MTQRKPPKVSFPDWVEQQIRDAHRKGEFHDLPGAGKPIADLDRPRDDMAWIAGYLRRENADIAALLPPALALAKEVELLPERVAGLRSQTQVRQLVEDLNGRIRAAHRFPQDGPPVRVWPVDIEEVLAQWRATREPPPVSTPPPSAPPRARRRWFRRRVTG